MFRRKRSRLRGATRELWRITNAEFMQSDWFEQVPREAFALIVSNPPYVADLDPHLREGDLRFEPSQALKGGPDGLTAIRTIVSRAPALSRVRTAGCCSSMDTIRPSACRRSCATRGFAASSRAAIWPGFFA